MRLAGLAGRTFGVVVDNAPDAILLVDAAPRVVLYNRAAERMFGHAAAEVLGRPLDLLLPAAVSGAPAQHLVGVIANSPATGPAEGYGEICGRRKGGERFRAEVACAQLPGQAERLVICVLRETGEREETGYGLRATAAWLRAISEHLQSGVPVQDGLGAEAWRSRSATEMQPELPQRRLQDTALAAAANAIVITDRDGQIEWVNPAFTRVTGYTAAEVLTRKARVLQSGQHDESFYREMWRTILAGKTWHGEMVNRRKDGSLYTEEMTITPVKDDGGMITHFIAIKQDVTDRKRLEEVQRTSYFRVAGERRRLEALNAQLLEEHQTVRRLTDLATTVAAGNLDRRAEISDDEVLGDLARALNAMADGLRDRIREREQSRRRIVAAEQAVRQQVAEQLHGSVQSKLLVLWYKLGRCQQLLHGDPDEADRILTATRAELDRLREEEVRGLSHQLHPAIVRTGLALSLEGGGGRRHRIDTQVQIVTSAGVGGGWPGGRARRIAPGAASRSAQPLWKGSEPACHRHSAPLLCSRPGSCLSCLALFCRHGFPMPRRVGASCWCSPCMELS